MGSVTPQPAATRTVLQEWDRAAARQVLTPGPIRSKGPTLSVRIPLWQLGGEPNFRPESLPSRSHSDYDEPENLTDMIRSNLIAERVAIEAYRQMVALIGDKDPTTRRLLEEILAVEEEHADELRDWLGQR